MSWGVLHGDGDGVGVRVRGPGHLGTFAGNPGVKAKPELSLILCTYMCTSHLSKL